ncbi:MAG: 23S rRNA (guanosine(2251)-2'-O)-methyltransferase RlmB [Desulfobacterales bacterium]
MVGKEDILFGIHPVSEVLRAGRRMVYEIYVASEKASKRIDRMTASAAEMKKPVTRVSTGKLTALTGTPGHQGAAARVGAYPYADLDAVIESDARTVPLVLLLDHIMDPQNLGAIIRTALCAGVNGIIIPKDRSAGATPAVSKASAGALEHIRLCRMVNMVNTMKTLKAAGFWMMGLDREGKDQIYAVGLTGRTGIVIGGEDTGIRPLVKKHCDVLMAIPQQTAFNSLNASAAAAVVLYEAYRQRITHNP